MAQKAGGFGPDAEFQKADSEQATVIADEDDFYDKLTKSSTNAKKQSPYGPQFPALDRYFKAR